MKRSCLIIKSLVVIPSEINKLVIIFDNSDFEWAEKYANLVEGNCHLFLQPEWSARDKVMEPIVEYVKAHPKWQISLQSHKYMRIP